MGNPTVLALRIVIALVLAGSLFVQVVMVPLFWADLYGATAGVRISVVTIAVLGIVFIALAAYALRSIWRAGIEGRSGQALALGVGGGIAVIIGAGCVAGAIILYLLAQTPTT